MSGLFDLRQAQAADAAGKDAAGKSTNLLNASFSAFDYAPSKLDHGRSFLMDDYLQTGRIARKREEPTRDRCWDVLHYQKDVAPFEPRQGFSETKFHSGFMRRQASQMPYLQQRVRARELISWRRWPFVSSAMLFSDETSFCALVFRRRRIAGASPSHAQRHHHV